MNSSSIEKSWLL